ncbi:MAG: hypothetical protein DI598_01735 [Pseudopedobacter saltans]|uniref:Uncharacterized protein n=1 Tax=Pseudopedobacter saltans TaxID=151895 RepID=A0A2W5F9K9_9SPHI|nr:MAG: hypothetical protein DI598_01735 [Pseudopedobacter saltans]
MKIVTFFATIVAAVLIGFVIFYVRTHGTLEVAKKLHVFVLSQNDDDFNLIVNDQEFTPNQAEEGDMGTYSFVGTVRKHHDSAFIQFKSQNIDTIFKIDVKKTDSIAIGAQHDGSLLLKKF